MTKKTLYWCLFAIVLLAIALIQFVPPDEPAPGPAPEAGEPR